MLGNPSSTYEKFLQVGRPCAKCCRQGGLTFKVVVHREMHTQIALSPVLISSYWIDSGKIWLTFISHFSLAWLSPACIITHAHTELACHSRVQCLVQFPCLDILRITPP